MTLRRPNTLERRPFPLWTLWLASAALAALAELAQQRGHDPQTFTNVVDVYAVVAPMHAFPSFAIVAATFAAIYGFAPIHLSSAWRRGLAWAHLLLTWLGAGMIYTPFLLAIATGSVTGPMDLGFPFEILNGLSWAGYLVILIGLLAYILIAFNVGRELFGWRPWRV